MGRGFCFVSGVGLLFWSCPVDLPSTCYAGSSAFRSADHSASRAVDGVVWRKAGESHPQGQRTTALCSRQVAVGSLVLG